MWAAESSEEFAADGQGTTSQITDVFQAMIALAVALVLAGSHIQGVQLRTAAHSRMMYYLGLPEGWSAKKKWPVVLAIADAGRDFEGAAKRFCQARKQLPYIIIAPMVVTDGGPGYREAPSYRYPQDTWNEINRVGEYAFDMDGIAAVLDDVQKNFSAEPKFYATGFEAGGHTLFALTFRHPELLYASIPNSPNFRGRGLDESLFSKKSERRTLPIHEIHGDLDPFSAPGKPFLAQWLEAESVGKTHGFGNFSTQVVRGKGHVWLADEILAYIESLRK